MKRALGVLSLLVVVGCGSAEPAPPADPCPDLRAEFERVRRATACEAAEDCVGAPGLRASARRADPDDPGRHGTSDGAPACATATHRDSLAAVESAAHAFEAAGCGEVVPAGTCNLGTVEGDHPPLCVGGECTVVF